MLEPTREEQARFETTLRGGNYSPHATDGTFDPLIVYEDGRLPDSPLDITTDTGLLDAMELLGLSVEPLAGHTDKWAATHWPGPYRYEHPSNRDAIRAAWYAAVNADKERHEA